MKTAFFVGMITIAAAAWAQAPPPNTVQNSQSTTVSSQSADAETGVDQVVSAELEAELTRGLDARKLNVGDPVLARCTQDFSAKGEVLIPKKAKLIGHIVEVQEKNKKGESVLGIVWDKALMSDGRELPLTASIQAIAPPAIMVDDSFDRPILASRPNSRPPASVVRHLNPTATSTLYSTSASAGWAPTNPLGSKTTGVVGIKGLQLDSAAIRPDNSSVIHSSSRNVRLESGTRLILRVSVQ